MPDEWRADAFGYAGNPVIRTPNIDGLAARGVNFPRAYCESPVCQPSRASLLGLRYPNGHGLQDNEHIARWRAGAFPDPSAPTFPQSLQAAGYYTAEIGKMHFALRLRDIPGSLAAYGFNETAEEFDKREDNRNRHTPYTDYLRERGLFESWCAEVAESAAMRRGDIPGPVGRAEQLDPEDTLDSFIGRQACDFLRRRANEPDPFCLWVGFVGPHMPYDGPRQYSDQYREEDIPLGPLGFDPFPENAYGEFLEWNVGHLRVARLKESDYRTMGKFYYGTASMIDAAVGSIVQTLEDTGLDDSTWIFFSSDHGELLGDHGFYSKRMFYRSSVQVPQLVVPPAYGAGQVSAGVSQGFDIPATILDLAGAKPVGAAGRSLRPAVDNPAQPARELACSEIAGFTMAAGERWKLVVHTASREPQALYDLANDPDERRSVLDEPACQLGVQELLAALSRQQI